jgi:UDP-glucose 4-epimerase
MMWLMVYMQIKIKEKPKKLGEQRRSCLSYQRAKDVLNWEPKINLEEGIKRTVAWTKSLKK